MGATVLAGHEGALAHLVALVRQGHNHHAFLVVGPPGVGKSTFVQLALERIYCERSSTTPCGECEACHRLASQAHSDVWQVKRASDKQDITIAQVRQLQKFVNLNSLSGMPRSVVLDDAAEANLEAQNALLKTLEEPPSNVYFFLVTSSERNVLSTIRSRCLSIHLGLVPAQAIAKLLRDQGVAANEAASLAARAGGRPAAALVLAHEPEVAQRDLAYARELLNLLQGQPWFDFEQLLERELSSTEGEAARALARSLVNTWLVVARDLLLTKLRLTHLVRYQLLKNELHLAVAGRDLCSLTAMLGQLALSQARLKANAHVRLTLEWLALSLPHL